MKKFRLVGAILVAATVLASCQKSLTDSQPSESLELNAAAAVKSTLPPSSNEIIVKFKKGITEKAKTETFGRANASLKEHILTKTMQRFGDEEGVYVLHTSLDSKAAAAQLKKMGEIEFAEPNYRYTYDAISNDPYILNSKCYGINGAWGCNADKAWAAGHTGSKNVCVGVIDQGAMWNHEDLKANFWVNPYDPVNGIDDDGNGYVDDTHGWDFFNNDNSTYDAMSDQHGTHVSGTIGAVGGNGVGVAGVNWNVTIISAKFIGDQYGSTEGAIKAIDYLTDLKLRHGINIVATNNSWGGAEESQALKDAIARAAQANILFVAAAGNDGVNNDTSPHYPAAFDNDNIISVAAIDNNGALVGFSNYGSTSVDIGAAGWWVYSTIPGEQYRGNGNKKPTIISTYNVMSGTSMACPHVTGAVALYASAHPGATAAQIKAAILSSTVPTPSLQGKTVSGGRLDVSKF